MITVELPLLHVHGATDKTRTDLVLR